MRALYRFQLHLQLFGVSHYAFHHKRRLKFRNAGILRIFFCLYEPWEVEEIACIYPFARKMFDQVFNNIHRDVHPANPVFEGQYPPTLTFNLDSECQFVPPSFPFPSHSNASATFCCLGTTNNHVIK